MVLVFLVDLESKPTTVIHSLLITHKILSTNLALKVSPTPLGMNMNLFVKFGWIRHNFFLLVNSTILQNGANQGHHCRFMP